MCVRYFSVRFPLILRSFFDSRTERERSANGGSTEDERRTNGERTENERRTNGERTENDAENDAENIPPNLLIAKPCTEKIADFEHPRSEC